MGIEWKFYLLEDDIYRIPKTDLQRILDNYKIHYSLEDTVPELRPVVAGIKSFLKNHLNSSHAEQAKSIFENLVQNREFLTQEQLVSYPDLARVQAFIEERGNLYDEIGSDYEIPIGPNNVSGDFKTPENKPKVKIPPENSPAPKMTEPVENIPLISASTFHGLSSENPTDFIEKYTVAAISNNWSNSTKVKLFPAHLSGIANSWFKHYSNGQQINDWEALKTDFIETFTPIAQINNLQVILENKYQKSDQTALNYYLEILTLCKRHEPTISDKQVIEYIMQGLKPDICDYILNENITTLDNLQKSLKKIEAKLAAKQQYRNRYERLSSNKVSRTQEDDRFNKREEASQDKLKSLEQKFEKNIETLSHVISNLKIDSRSRSKDRRDERGRYWEGRTYGNGRRQPSRDRSGDYEPRRDDSRYGQGSGGYRRVTFNHRSAERRFDKSPYRWQPKGDRAQETKPGRSTTRKFCSYCKRTNHNINECRIRLAKEYTYRADNIKKYCKICKKNNHNAENCFFRNKKENNNQKNG